MDELEISGKRYISSRRAAKENNYTSDYIGQLIRGKKVLGQKVGRSWYVSEESLKAYFSGEGLAAPQIPAVPHVEAQVPEPVIVERIIERIVEVPAPAPVVTPVVEIQKEIVKEVTSEPEEYKVPITLPTRVEEKKFPSGLTYIADDAPLIPELSKSREENPVPLRVHEEVVHVQEEQRTNVRVPRTRRSTPLLTLASLGVLTFALVSALSYFLVYNGVVDGGQLTATVTFSGFH